jgi:hypothetical protein
LVGKSKNRKKGMELASFLTIAAGQFPGYPSHPAIIETFAQRLSVLFWHFPAAFKYRLRLPRGYPRNIRLFPVAFL